MKYSGALGHDKGGKAKLVGIVRVTTGSNMAKLAFEEDGKVFKNGTPELKVAMDDLPAMPRIPANDKVGKLYRVRMSQDGMDVEALGPVSGQFKAILVDVSRSSGKDSDPAPYEKVWNEGKDNENSHQEFWLSYQVTDGHFRVVILPSYKLHYKFEEDPAHPGFTKFVGNPENAKATRLHQLIRWGNLYGVWDEPIPWADDGNVLPEIFDRAMETERVVDVTIVDGYPTDVTTTESYDEDDEQPKKKVAKKAPVKATKVAPKAVKAPAKKKVRREDY